MCDLPVARAIGITPTLVSVSLKSNPRKSWPQPFRAAFQLSKSSPVVQINCSSYCADLDLNIVRRLVQTRLDSTRNLPKRGDSYTVGVQPPEGSNKESL